MRELAMQRATAVSQINDLAQLVISLPILDFRFNLKSKIQNRKFKTSAKLAGAVAPASPSQPRGSS
jgi:hypothetical protein